MQNYTFTDPKTNDVSNIPVEAWCWEAHYSNGEILKQFSDDGIFHQFKEIDQSRLVYFIMVSPYSKNRFRIVFDSKTMKLIHFYRNTILDHGTPNESKHRFYFFGYSKILKGKEVLSLFSIMPNGELVITDDKNLKSFG